MCDLELQLNSILYPNQDENENKNNSEKGWPSWSVPSLNGTDSCDSEPSPQEIKQLFALLSFEFPKGKAKSIIKRLHKHVITQSGYEANQSIIEKNLQIIDEANPTEIMQVESNINSLTEIEIIQRNIDLVQTLIHNPSFQAQFYRCQSAIKESTNRQSQRREETRQSIALALCQFGYGHQTYCDYQLRCRKSGLIKRSKYAMLARSVINDTFQRIEQYLQLFTDITPNNQVQLTHSFQFLHHFKANMDPDDSQAFLTAIQMAFQLKHAPVNQRSIATLYLAVQEFIKKKMEEKQMNQKLIRQLEMSNPESLSQNNVRAIPPLRKKRTFARISTQSVTRQLQKIWDDEMDMELITFFIKDCNFSNMREQFRQRYSQYSHLFNGISLRGHFQKVIRLALRKLRACLDALGRRAPKMVWMNDKRIKYLMLTESQEVAQELLKMYCQDFTMQQLEKTVNAINILVAKKDAESEKNYKEVIQEEKEVYDMFPHQEIEISSEFNQEEFKRTKALFVGQTYKSMSTRSTSKIYPNYDNQSSSSLQDLPNGLPSHRK